MTARPQAMKPLQVSTNIIRPANQLRPLAQSLKPREALKPTNDASKLTNDANLKPKNDSLKKPKDTLKKKPQHLKAKPSTKSQSKTKPQPSDENDIPCNQPLNIYTFDEELYEKVCKLELADDGFPPIEAPTEPFDF